MTYHDLGITPLWYQTPTDVTMCGADPELYRRGELRWLPQSTPHFQDLPPLYCYVMCIRLPESTPLFNKYMRPSQNILLPPRIYPPFQHLYATLPESAPPSQNIFQFWEQVVDSLIITKAPRKGGIFSD